MIRVAVHPDKELAVTEFFELFKTEWTRHSPGDESTVLLTDGSIPPDRRTTLCIVFTSNPQPGDEPSDGPFHTKPGTVILPTGDELPIYTRHRFFETPENPLIKDAKGKVLAYRKGNIIRCGFDLFEEVKFLLTTGQPVKNAAIPTLDRHIAFVRNCILRAGLPVIEIPPCPPNNSYMVCLTHDVDFVSIRHYGIGKTFQGFLKRALIGSFRRVFRGQLTLTQLFRNYAAVFSIPLVHLGLKKDFWMQFDEYCRIEEPQRSTFFLIPFKDQPGENILESHPKRRASRYDVGDIRDDVLPLIEKGWEFGLHGIDAWHDPDNALREKERMESALNGKTAGIRMHWLCRNGKTEDILDEAGFDFDSTFGYNETVGFRAGTSQVYMPLAASHLLEVPLHIQDVAMFYPTAMNLSIKSAWNQCLTLMGHQKENGGVITVLWHMRSLAPERLWGEFYKKLLKQFREDHAWFGTARQTAEWFRNRRQIQISHSVAPDGELIVHLRGRNSENRLKVCLRIYKPDGLAHTTKPIYTDLIWDGSTEIPTGCFETAQISPEKELATA